MSGLIVVTAITCIAIWMISNLEKALSRLVGLR